MLCSRMADLQTEVVPTVYFYAGDCSSFLMAGRQSRLLL